MYTFLLILLIVDSLVLGTVILLQAGKGGGLAASFGGASSSTDSFLGTRQAGNLLTRTTWWAGALFLILAFILQILSARQRAPRSILEQGLGAPAPITAPAEQAPTTPAVPLQPAPEAVPPTPDQ